MTRDCLDLGCRSKSDLPIDGAIYTPYVKVTIGGKDFLLTGNASSPSNSNRAMITSFQYGGGTGTGNCGGTIEVADEGGTTYERVYEELSKDLTTNVEDGKKCSIEFGWKIKKCDGTSELFTNLNADAFPDGGGGKLNLILHKFNTTFDGSLVKYNIEFRDGFAKADQNRLESNVGTEDGKSGFKNAMEQLFTEYDPKLAGVEFISSSGQRKLFDPKNPGMGGFKFKGNPVQGYFSVFNMDQEANIACGRKWLNSTLTAEDKGILLMFDPSTFNAVCYEDPSDYSNCCGNGYLATFVVNGGNNSQVISFSPSFDWNYGANSGSGGVASGGSSSDVVKQEEDEGFVNAGVQSQHLPDGNMWHFSNPQNHVFEASENFNKHNKATRPWEGMIQNITAELKIMGNPRWANPLFLTSKWISIVVINPYYIESDTSSGGNCGWLTKSNCNPILSNKAWQITGIDHQITSGSYFTTIKVFLPAPGITTTVDEKGQQIPCGSKQLKKPINTNPSK